MTTNEETKTKERKDFCECGSPKENSSWNKVTWFPALYGYKRCLICDGIYPKHHSTIEDFNMEFEIRKLSREEALYVLRGTRLGLVPEG